MARVDTINRTDEVMTWDCESPILYFTHESAGPLPRVNKICSDERYVAALRKKHSKVPSLLNLAVRAVSRYQLPISILPTEMQELVRDHRYRLWREPYTTISWSAHFLWYKIRYNRALIEDARILERCHFEVFIHGFNFPPVYPSEDMDKRLGRILTNYCPNRSNWIGYRGCPYV